MEICTIMRLSRTILGVLATRISILSTLLIYFISKHIYHSKEPRQDMNKADLIAQVAASCKIPKTTSERAIDQIFASITLSLERGEKVSLPGFGSFNVSDRPARSGRNPGTGEAIEIPAAKVVKFTASTALKQALKEGLSE